MRETAPGCEMASANFDSSAIRTRENLCRFPRSFGSPDSEKIGFDTRSAKLVALEQIPVRAREDRVARCAIVANLVSPGKYFLEKTF
jgi:hypothetical protein